MLVCDPSRLFLFIMWGRGLSSPFPCEYPLVLLPFVKKTFLCPVNFPRTRVSQWNSNWLSVTVYFWVLFCFNYLFILTLTPWSLGYFSFVMHLEIRRCKSPVVLCSSGSFCLCISMYILDSLPFHIHFRKCQFLQNF